VGIGPRGGAGLGSVADVDDVCVMEPDQFCIRSGDSGEVGVTLPADALAEGSSCPDVADWSDMLCSRPKNAAEIERDERRAVDAGAEVLVPRSPTAHRRQIGLTSVRSFTCNAAIDGGSRHWQDGESPESATAPRFQRPLAITPPSRHFRARHV
jgi:hypothetical protein